MSKITETQLANREKVKNLEIGDHLKAVKKYIRGDAVYPCGSVFRVVSIEQERQSTIIGLRETSLEVSDIDSDPNQLEFVEDSKIDLKFVASRLSDRLGYFEIIKKRSCQ